MIKIVGEFLEAHGPQPADSMDIFAIHSNTNWRPLVLRSERAHPQEGRLTTRTARGKKMKRGTICALAFMLGATAAQANDWQKFYRPISSPESFIPSTSPPEQVTSSGNLAADIDMKDFDMAVFINSELQCN